MQIKTNGLIIRDINVGESDRIVTILTREKGVIRASARGARGIKSRLSTACQLFSYSDFTLFRGREKYIINEAESLELFMGLRKDLSILSLSQYFAELIAHLAPQEDEAGIYLRLILNALHLIELGKRPLPLIKAAFEMRILTISGYMPNLVACSECGCFETDLMYFYPDTGVITCAKCINSSALKCPLSKGSLAGLRHTVYADFERLFSFLLTGVALDELSNASEKYLLSCLERSFPTLEFYRGLQTM